MSLSNPIISESLLILTLPFVYYGSVGGCLPTPCTVYQQSVIFSSLSINIQTMFSVKLINVVNPLSLGLSSSFIFDTQLYSNQTTSIVDEVKDGLSPLLVARKFKNTDIAISCSSDVVYDFPVKFTFSVNNNNIVPAYSYLVIILPVEIQVESNSIICYYDSALVYCTYDSITQ
jgi:hypothetical protein